MNFSWKKRRTWEREESTCLYSWLPPSYRCLSCFSLITTCTNSSLSLPYLRYCWLSLDVWSNTSQSCHWFTTICIGHSDEISSKKQNLMWSSQPPLIFQVPLIIGRAKYQKCRCCSNHQHLSRRDLPKESLKTSGNQKMVC